MWFISPFNECILRQHPFELLVEFPGATDVHNLTLTCSSRLLKPDYYVAVVFHVAPNTIGPDILSCDAETRGLETPTVHLSIYIWYAQTN